MGGGYSHISSVSLSLVLFPSLLLACVFEQQVALPLLPFPEEKGDDVANKLRDLLK